MEAPGNCRKENELSCFCRLNQASFWKWLFHGTAWSRFHKIASEMFTTAGCTAVNLRTAYPSGAQGYARQAPFTSCAAYFARCNSANRHPHWGPSNYSHWLQTFKHWILQGQATHPKFLRLLGGQASLAASPSSSTRIPASFWTWGLRKCS